MSAIKHRSHDNPEAPWAESCAQLNWMLQHVGEAMSARDQIEQILFNQI